MKNLDFATIRESVNNAYANGTGTFKEVAAAAGLEYIPAGKSKLTKRATPTVEINGRAYDFHAFLKACNIDIVKHERLTAGGERIPAHRSRVEKIEAARSMFITRLIDITGIKPETSDKIDLNTIFAIASKAAANIDKKEAEKREKEIEAQKAARKQAKAEKALESYSIEEIEALLEKRKEAAAKVK